MEIQPGLFAKVIGHGPHIVMLHGLNVSHRSWGNEFPNLLQEANYSVVMPDMPGFGQSEVMEDLAVSSAQKIISYLETLPKPVVLVGHSYGGGVAIIIAHLRPDLIDRLVLIAPGGCYPSPRSRGRLEWLDPHVAHAGTHVFMKAASQARVTKAMAKYMPERSAYLEWHVENTPAAIKSLVAYNVDKAATEIDVPTLLVWGDQDRVIFPPLMKRLQKRTGWNHRIFPGTGHLLPLDQPHELGQTILDWLKDPVKAPIPVE